jgi:hypothetical protein
MKKRDRRKGGVCDGDRKRCYSAVARTAGKSVLGVYTAEWLTA